MLIFSFVQFLLFISLSLFFISSLSFQHLPFYLHLFFSWSPCRVQLCSPILDANWETQGTSVARWGEVPTQGCQNVVTHHPSGLAVSLGFQRENRERVKQSRQYLADSLFPVLAGQQTLPSTPNPCHPVNYQMLSLNTSRTLSVIRGVSKVCAQVQFQGCVGASSDIITL